MRPRSILLAASAFVLACSLAPASARAGLMGSPLLGDEDAPTGPLLGFGVFAGAPTNSYTRVREGSDRGTYLYFQDDVGIPVVGEAQLQLGWRFTADDALALGVGYLFIGGGRRTNTNLEYNATTLAGGTVETVDPMSVHWFVFELQYERTLVRFMGHRGLLALDLAIRYDDLDWRFATKTIAQGSLGAEAGEDFRTQSIPIPLIGLTARIPISEDWDVVLAARGSRLNHISSGRSEGGIVYISESVIDATAGFTFKASDLVQISFGYRFLYVDIDGESREDGNLIGAFTHGAYFTVLLSF
jgi:hypothetical protein